MRSGPLREGREPAVLGHVPGERAVDVGRSAVQQPCWATADNGLEPHGQRRLDLQSARTPAATRKPAHWDLSSSRYRAGYRRLARPHTTVVRDGRAEVRRSSSEVDAGCCTLLADVLPRQHAIGRVQTSHHQLAQPMAPRFHGGRAEAPPTACYARDPPGHFDQPWWLPVDVAGGLGMSVSN